METYYGVAIAFHGTPITVTATLVGGEDKPTLREIESRSKKLVNVSRAVVEATLEELADVVHDAAGRFTKPISVSLLIGYSAVLSLLVGEEVERMR